MTKERSAWRSMKARCLNPSVRGFKYWGGRGIKVCDRWIANFSDFLADVGPAPTPRHTLDRINNDGNYEPGNVRWATYKEQANNRRQQTTNSRPPKQSITVRMSPKNHRWATRNAKTLGMSFSSFLNLAVTQARQEEAAPR